MSYYTMSSYYTIISWTRATLEYYSVTQRLCNIVSHRTTLYYRRECTVWPCSIPNLLSLNSKQQFNGKKYSARLARVPGITITGTTTITGITRASVMGTITTTVADTTETSVTATTTSLSLWAERFPAPIELDHQTSRSRRNRGHQRGATIVKCIPSTWSSTTTRKQSRPLTIEFCGSGVETVAYTPRRSSKVSASDTGGKCLVTRT